MPSILCFYMLHWLYDFNNNFNNNNNTEGTEGTKKQKK